LHEKAVVTLEELFLALKRYLEESGDSEQTIASHIGIHPHALAHWISDKKAPSKAKAARIALFLRRARYL